ncbi:MAG: regulatory iron-sulfur-containing complex subunit RicT [Candidatus Berkelbacteria bacterium]|nr:regulatory iron-sulfur-containing complex subunit RicT [Candidatus Berkelbacteria bacterium]
MSDTYIKVRSDSRFYTADHGNLQLVVGDQVLFESDRCQEIAFVIAPVTKQEEQKNIDINGAVSKAVIIRRLNEKDLEHDKELKKEAVGFLTKCRQIVSKHNLPMELLDADLSFDNTKLTFYFSAPGRVDFRSLVSELASTFQKLIRLQQVGARDRARCVGGIGRCGQEFCCKRYLKGELESVSSDMAYDQNLAQMGPNRVTGACGKLMCCLKYELDFYKKAKANMPAVGSRMTVSQGKGIVVSQCILKNTVTLEFENKTYLEVDCTPKS